MIKTGFAIRGIPAKEASPDAIAAIGMLKQVKMRLGNGEFPENIDHERNSILVQHRNRAIESLGYFHAQCFAPACYRFTTTWRPLES